MLDIRIQRGDFELHLQLSIAPLDLVQLLWVLVNLYLLASGTVLPSLIAA